MKKTIPTLLLLCITWFTTLAQNPINIPNPELFAKQWLSLVKQQDSIAFVDSYNVTKEHLNAFISSILNEEHISASRKENLKKELNDSNIDKILTEFRTKIAISYSTLRKSIEAQAIDVSKLEYVRTYYEIEYRMGMPICVIDNALILCKYNNLFYGFKFDEIFYFQELWFGAELQSIKQYDAHLEEIYIPTETQDYINEMPIPADTVAVAEASEYVESNVESTEQASYSESESSGEEYSEEESTSQESVEQKPVEEKPKSKEYLKAQKKADKAYQKYLLLSEKLYGIQ